MKTLFTSDTHFNHKKIIKLANRPFNDLEHMNEQLIKNWNSVVNENDRVFHLGDFAFSKSSDFFNRLNGEKHLIFGNHDEEKTGTPECNWASQKYYHELTITTKFGNKHVVLFHYPILNWHWMGLNDEKGSIHLYGHVHDKVLPSMKKNSYNVGVEMLDYFPRTLDEILQKDYNKPLI